MFRLILWLVFITMKAEANVLETENPEIRLSNRNSGNENYTVWKDKPLKIILENIYPRYVWCSNTFNKCASSYNLRSTCLQFVPETEFSNNIINILNIKNVTAKMSTRWMCTALQACPGLDMPCIYYKNRRYTKKYLHFNLHVKGAKAVILNANDQKLTYVTKNMSVNYDGEANYTYEDGEDFSFSCEKAKHNPNEDTLRLEYYNAKGILLFQTKPRDQQQQHIFRSVLKSNNDKYYLDCICAAGHPEREYRFRITFFRRDFLADTSQHAVVLSVNDQNLTTYRNNDQSFDNYIFRYIDGEVLTVTCQKMDVNIRGPLYFYGDRMSQTLRSYNPSEAVISLNISTSDIKNKSLSCVIKNTNLDKPNAKLLFLSDVPDEDVRISGLPRNDILYQYTNNKNQWTIEYQYSVNDSLNLTCVWNGFNAPLWLSPSPQPFHWKFVDDTIHSAAIRTPRSRIKFSKTPFTITLDAAHNGTIILCTYFSNGIHDVALSKTVEIILRLKQELVSEAKGGEVTLDTPDDKSMIMIVPVAVGVGVAIAVMTMVCLGSWRRRMKRGNLIENANDNLPNQNDSPIPPFPSQWEDNYDDPNYAKIHEEVMQENYNYSTDNDKLCRMPDKRQSNTSENHYTEIDDYVKPKPDGLAANWNTARLSNYNKHTHITTAFPNGSYNNLPINNCNKNYSNVPKPSKSVTFRQMSNDLRPIRNYSEGNSRQDGRNNERKVKPNNDSHYANTGQDNIYMKPVDMHKKPDYDNHFLQNEKTDNPLDSDYAEPYEIPTIPKGSGVATAYQKA